MNFIKRAMLAVIRKKGKTLILFVIFAAIANLVLAGYAIRHASDYASVLARQKLGGKLTLRFDMQGAMEKAMAQIGGQQGQRSRVQAENITEDMVSEIAAHKNILDYNYIISSAAMAEGFEPVVTEQEETEEQPPNNRMQGRFNLPDGANITIPDVSVTGAASTELMDAFSNGEATLLEGRHISHEDAGKNVVLIEKNLASQNGLKTGDKIKLKPAGDETAVEFSIIGIYEASPDAEVSGPRMGNMAFTEPYNKIYTDYKAAKALTSEAADTGTGRLLLQMSDSAEFFIDDPRNIDKVLEDSKTMKIDWDKFVLDANDSAYEQMMAPIESVASFSKIALYIVAIAGAIILGLILMLSIKERVYETGVLLSMGEGKVKVIAQYVTEVILIAAVAFSVSAFTGRFIAQGVGDMLLKREVSMASEQGSQVFGQNNAGFGRGGGQFARLLQRRFQTGPNGDIKPIDSIDIEITPAEVGRMFGAGFIIIIAGTILPASNVMRYKPRAILTRIS